MAKKINHYDVYQIILFVALAALAIILSQFIIGLPLGLILGNTAGKPVWTLIYYLASYSLAIALIILVFPQIAKKCNIKRSRRKKAVSSGLEQALSTSPAEIGVNTYPTFVDLGLAPIGYILYAVLASLLTNLVSLIFPSFDANQSQNVGFNYAFLSAGDRAMAILAIVFIAPIAEELILRGWLYGKLRTKLSFVSAALIVSVLFGVLHGQWNVGIATFVMSIILCSLREITGTVWSGMIMHILSNGIAFYLLYVMQFV